MKNRIINVFTISVLITMLFTSGSFASDKDTNQEVQDGCNSYLHKIWIVEPGEDSSIFFDASFFLSKIENGQAEGKLMEGVAKLESNYANHEMEPVNRNLHGTLKNNIFEGTVKLSGEELGTVRICFLDENRARLYMKYSGERVIVDKTYNLKVYNYSDIIRKYNMMEERNRIFPVELDIWGKVYVRTGVADTQKTSYPLAYLTDEAGNIFFEFSASSFVETEDNKVQISSPSIEVLAMEVDKDASVDYIERDLELDYTYIGKLEGFQFPERFGKPAVSSEEKRTTKELELYQEAQKFWPKELHCIEGTAYLQYWDGFSHYYRIVYQDKNNEKYYRAIVDGKGEIQEE